MRHRGVFIVLALVGTALAAPGHGPRALHASDTFRVRRAAPAAPVGAIPGEVVVRFRDHVREADAADLLWEAGGRTARRSRTGSNAYLMKVDYGFTSEDAIERLQASPEVEYVERNARVHAYFSPNDQLFCRQWHMKMMAAERTWDIQRGAPSVAVAVLDTGVAYENFGAFRRAPDLAQTTFLPGFDFVNGDTHPNDDNFHGTFVTGIIAESTNNALGLAGLAFQTAILPVKVLDREGSGSTFDVAEGIRFAAHFTQNGTRPVKVINLSLGGDTFSRLVSDAVDEAVRLGVTVVAASGNENTSVGFPAAQSNVIAVGAVDARKQRAFYSNFGAALDLVAPGGDLDRDDDGACTGGPDRFPDGVLQETLDPDFSEVGRFDTFAYLFIDGTSFSAPHVAAVAALLYTQGITEPAAIQAAMEQTAEDLGARGRDDQYGHGLVRPAQALTGLGFGH